MSTSQMLKGVLEGCLLAVISKGEIYGYEMIEKLEAYGFTMVSEGSIYPILLRMKKEELVTTTLKPSPTGPKRKYYSLTPKGVKELKDFRERWFQLSNSVSNLLNHTKVKEEIT
ncbi:PadR family transcriptional regulator, regulatory protein PadR [Fictibacillus solisalsi]|uniref:PadR family transcriptional regulator, regulatory protein PadR n=1 Tax=Fictibacillus solisalsi TaxID=459525 RepID=A0A1G9U2Q6_9BACL|nr:PadR family transcriptional regulator [Fictibacillus solisalsi]SDM54198.1 PadR family transcriptional regulator, regulatory protein PadR [Fictibacillus solisalsi]